MCHQNIVRSRPVTLLRQEESHAGETDFCVDLWLSALCISMPVIYSEFDPEYKSVLSHSFIFFQPVLVEHHYYLQPGQLTHNNHIFL